MKAKICWSKTPCNFDFANVNGDKMAKLMDASGNEYYMHPGGVISTATDRILECPTYLRGVK